MIVESWEGDPAGDEPRREVLITSGSTVDGRRNMALQPIERGEGGLMRVGDPQTVMSAGDTGVAWQGLLDDFFRGYFTARLADDGAADTTPDTEGA